MKQTINLICPRCGNSFVLEDAIKEMEQRELADIAAKFGQSWRLVFEYSKCFRTQQYGGVNESKRIRKLRELGRIWSSCEFDYNGKRWRTSRSEIMARITQICDLEKWGFHNHNYLKVILLKTAKRVSAEGMTAEEEREREKGRRGEREQPSFARATEGREEAQFLGNTAHEARKRIVDILTHLGEDK
jgi:hypothetical protein